VQVLHSKLESLVKQANFDGALRLLDDQPDLESSISQYSGRSVALSLACMASDVLDYGGQYPTARSIIAEPGKLAETRLESFLKEPFSIGDDEAPRYKQESWALMHWGMAEYRRFEFDLALHRFEISRNLLDELRRQGHVYNGSLSRAWYYIGLCHRELFQNSKAKHAFSRSVQYGWYGMEARHKIGKPLDPYDYNIGKCFALGSGWIKYNEASLAEAYADLAAARRLLLNKNVRFIKDYVTIIHACVSMSANSHSAQHLDESIKTLEKCQASLLLKGVEKGKGHIGYAMRAANELALAYYRRALLEKTEADQNALFIKAEPLLQEVKAWAREVGGKRILCKALITQSRIARARVGQEAAALDCAAEAVRAGAGLRSSEIDSQIALGESYFLTKSYSEAIKAFTKALNSSDGHPKVSAACRLHLAESYLADGNSFAAREQFQLWKHTGQGVENGFVRGMSERLQKAVDSSKTPFSLSREAVKLEDHKEAVNQMRGWLTEVALERSGGNYTDACKRLKIAYTTFVKWRNDAKLKIHAKLRPQAIRQHED
jgi:tetratricopeptide (TPR) repeat protein